ncbi:MAG: hypothetical protein ACR2GY_10860 [Phycisphaerales bacterium]
MHFPILFVAIVVSCISTTSALAQGDSAAKVTVSAVADRSSVIPGGHVVVAVILDHENGWHTHTNAPQLPDTLSVMAETVIPTSIDAQSQAAGANIHTDKAQWPDGIPVTVAWLGERNKVEYAVYEWRTIVYVPITIAPDAAIGSAAVNLNVTFQACDDAQCLAPATVPVSTSFAIAESEGGMQHAELFSNFDEGVWNHFAQSNSGSSGAGPTDDVPGSESPESTQLLIWLLGGAGAVACLALIFYVMKKVGSAGKRPL